MQEPSPFKFYAYETFMFHMNYWLASKLKNQNGIIMEITKS